MAERGFATLQSERQCPQRKGENMKRYALLVCVVGLTFACDEDKKKEDVAPASAQPVTSASAAPATVASTNAASPATSSAPVEQAVPAGETRFAVATGKATFLIDAPLEKIKGMSDETRGHVDANPKDLAKTRGELLVRMSTLKTSTFGDVDKDVAQTGHARNWMEVGNDAAAATRMKYEWASFALTSVEATPASLPDAKEENGARSVKAKVGGDLTLHGVTSHKTVPMTITFKGPADAPTEMVLKTDEPIFVSMKEHDIMPRDKIGGLLNGALDRIGKKIDDNVAVSFEADLKATPPPHP
jgi:polyisoprenoid-binding protein YceI